MKTRSSLLSVNETFRSDLRCYLFERDWIIPPPTIFGYINLANQVTVRSLCVKMQELCKIPTRLPINPSRNNIMGTLLYLVWLLSTYWERCKKQKYFNTRKSEWTHTRSFDSWLKTSQIRLTDWEVSKRPSESNKTLNARYFDESHVALVRWRAAGIREKYIISSIWLAKNI